MFYLSWVLVGLVAGFLASKIVNQHGESVFTTILLGIVGALVGGYLFQLAGINGMTGFSAWSLLLATAGAVLLLTANYLIGRRGWAGDSRAP